MKVDVLSYNFHRHFANFEVRKPLLNNILNSYEFDILCAQEFLPSNVNKLMFEKLNKDYTCFATYMNPIFFNTHKFTYVDSIKLKHNKFVAIKLHTNETDMIVCNLHLNYGFYKLNEKPRIVQLTGYLDELAKFNSDNLPCIISGDFNCLPTAETLTLLSDYKTTYIPGSLKESTLNDYCEVDNGEIIDHTFVKGFDVLKYNIISDSFNGQIPSDHYPILSQISLTNI